MQRKELVIEDEHRMRRILQLLLEENGYDIKMPRAEGMKVLELKNRRNCEPGCVPQRYT